MELREIFVFSYPCVDVTLLDNLLSPNLPQIRNLREVKRACLIAQAQHAVGNRASALHIKSISVISVARTTMYIPERCCD